MFTAKKFKKTRLDSIIGLHADERATIDVAETSCVMWMDFGWARDERDLFASTAVDWFAFCSDMAGGFHWKLI